MRAPSSGVDCDEELLRRHRRDGDLDARDELVARHLPLARRLARRYHSRSEPIDDLEQVAAVGLIKALARFDPRRGVAFSSFAVPTIQGELRRHLRDTTWTVRPPRSVQERAVAVGPVTEELTAELRRSPTSAEVAERLGCSVERVLEAREAALDYYPASLDGAAPGGDQEPLGERIGEIDDHFESIDAALSVEPALKALPARDRLVVLLRFEQELTQAEIAAHIGVSQMHVSRILRRSLERLRSVVDHALPADDRVAA